MQRYALASLARVYTLLHTVDNHVEKETVHRCRWLFRTSHGVFGLSMNFTGEIGETRMVVNFSECNTTRETRLNRVPCNYYGLYLSGSQK